MTPPPPPADDDGRDAPAARVAAVGTGVAVGLAAAGLVLVGRSAGVLEGPPALALAVVAVLAVPTSREASRRVLLAGCTVLGWLPLTWWFAWPGDLGRSGVLLAALVGGLAGWVAAGPGRRRRAALLVPRVRVVDALPVLAALAAVVVVWPWLAVSTGGHALSLLLQGWDHSAHYDIVAMMRQHGVVVSAAGPAPLGDTWSYGAYPQGFHATAASLMELLGGPAPGSAAAEVLLYARTLGLMAVTGTALLAAGIAALPFVRRRPFAAAPAVALVVGGFLLGPTGWVLHDGFPNFALAAVLLACIPLIVLSLAQWPPTTHLVALGGALLGVAHGWVPLLVMGLPAAAVLLVPWPRRGRVHGRRLRALDVVVIALTAVGGLVAVGMVSRQPVTEVLTIAGAVTPLPLWLLVGPALLAAVGCLAAAWPVRPLRPLRTRPPRSLRMVATAVVPLAGIAGAMLIAAVQLRAGGELGYYFRKFAMAMALMSIVLIAVAAVWAVPHRPSWVRRPRTAWAAAAVATLVATQAYGFTVPGDAVPGASPALRLRSDTLAAARTEPGLAEDLWAAADAGLAPDRRHVFLAAPDLNAASAGQWYNAVAGRWTDESNELLRLLLGPAGTPAERAAVATQVLSADADAVVIVRPQERAELAGLVGPDLGERVVSW